MKEIIKQNIQGKKVLFFFALATVVYIFMLAVTIPKVMSYSGGMKLPDMLPTGYSPEYINALLNQFGEEGRNTYLFHRFRLIWFIHCFLPLAGALYLHGF